MKNFNLNTFQERLKWARKMSKLSQAELSERIGINQSSYSELETGKSRSSTHTPKIAKLLNIDAYWLDTGEGEPKADTADDIIAKISQLNPKQRQAVEAVIDSFFDGQKPNNNQ